MKVLKSTTVKKVKKEKVPKELKIKSTSADPVYDIKTTNKEIATKKGEKVLADNYEKEKELRSVGIKRKNILSTGEELIPTEFGEIKKEKDELKLLKYQIERNDGNVNEFLLSKYSSGEFNKAIYDGYDNSLIRLDSGLEFEYHVYFPIRLDANGRDYFANNRPASFMIKTKPLLDRKTNDNYIYHFPVHLYDNLNYATDFTNELISVFDNKSNGLIAALNILSNHLLNDNPNLPNEVFTILQSNGFIDNKDKLNLAIKDVMVEKYFKAVKSGKKMSSVEYLNKTMTPSADVKVDENNISGDAFVQVANQVDNTIQNLQTPVKKPLKMIQLNLSIPKLNYTPNLENNTYTTDLNAYDIVDKNGNSITGFSDIDDIINNLKYTGYKVTSLEEQRKSGSFKKTKRVVILLENVNDKNDKNAIVFSFTAGAGRVISYETIDNIMKFASEEQVENIKNGIIQNTSNLKDIMNFIRQKGLINFVSNIDLNGKGGFTKKVL